MAKQVRNWLLGLCFALLVAAAFASSGQASTLNCSSPGCAGGTDAECGKHCKCLTNGCYLRDALPLPPAVNLPR